MGPFGVSRGQQWESGCAVALSHADGPGPAYLDPHRLCRSLPLPRLTSRAEVLTPTACHPGFDPLARPPDPPCLGPPVALGAPQPCFCAVGLGWAALGWAGLIFTRCPVACSPPAALAPSSRHNVPLLWRPAGWPPTRALRSCASLRPYGRAGHACVTTRARGPLPQPTPRLARLIALLWARAHPASADAGAAPPLSSHGTRTYQCPAHPVPTGFATSPLTSCTYKSNLCNSPQSVERL